MNLVFFFFMKKFMHSKNVPLSHIVIESDEIKAGKEYVYFGWMVDMCQNIDVENKIRVEGIYHDKRCAQGKAGQDTVCQSLLLYHFVSNIISKQNVDYHEEGRTESYLNIHAENIVWAHLKWGNLGEEWNEGCDHRVPKEVLLGWTLCKFYRWLINLFSWYPRNRIWPLRRHPQWWDDKIVKWFRLIRRRRARSRMKWKCIMASDVENFRQHDQ